MFLKNRDKIVLHCLVQGHESSHSDVDEALYERFLMACQNNVPLNRPVLLAMAEKFTQELGHQDFKATGSWLQRFKTQKGIVKSYKW